MSTEFSRLRIRLNKFTAIMGGLLFFIPLILIYINGGVRSSISDYAYMDRSEWFVGLISIAGAVFIMDGAIWNKRWYNIILGLSLVGIALTPFRLNLAVAILHYTFAGVFFAGSVFVMVYFSSRRQRPVKILMGVHVVAAMLLNFTIPGYGLFWAEWLGMLPIVLHFLGETFNKLD